MRRALLLFVLAAFSCTHPPKDPVVPTLPGDGDAHVAKPPPSKKPIEDPYAGKELILPDAPGPAVPVALAPLESFKLGNGLQVYIIRDDKLPVASMQLAVRAGRQSEPRARLGVGELTADLLVKGTRHHDAAAIAKAVDTVGATITADATFEATVLSCSALRRNLDTCLTLLPEMVTEPTFPQDELVKQRDQMKAGVAARLKDAASLASLEVQNLLWGEGHVRSWVNSEPSVQEITREDVLAWHKAWFTPANTILVITGDVDGKKIKGDVERAFGEWRKTPVPPTPTYPEPGLSGTRIRIVDWPGAPQAQIRIAQFGIKHEDPRFFDALVMNYALGGGSQSRLARTLRAGGTSNFDRNNDRGSLVISTLARNGDAVTQTKLALAEITRMAKEGPTDEEVAIATANLAGSWGMRFQTAADIGAALVGAELHGFGAEYLTNYAIAVKKVDAASARRAASEILDTRNFVIVLVGDAKDIEPAVKKEGWRYEKVSFTDVITPLVAPPVDAKGVAAAKNVIDDAVAAKGGLAKLQGITSIHIQAKGTTVIVGSKHDPIPVEVDRTFVVPDKLRIQATLTPEKNQTAVVTYGADGSKGWAVQPDQSGKNVVVDIPQQAMGSLDFDRWRDPDLILLRAADAKAKLAPLADETIDGKGQQVVRLSSPFAGIDVTLYFDKSTHLMTRMTYSDAGFTSTDDFANYKDVQGVKIAHKRPSHDKNRDTTLEITKVELNTKIDPATFAKPANP